MQQKLPFILRFSFDATGAKEKLAKENAEKIFALCGGRGGLRDLHRASF